MSISSDGILAFGIKFDDELPDDWDKYEDDFEDYLLKLAGLTYNDDYDKRREVLAAAPVELIIHCSYDYTMYILAVKGVSKIAGRGHPVAISDEEFQVSEEKITAMKIWCDLQGVEWSEPQWYLCSLYG